MAPALKALLDHRIRDHFNAKLRLAQRSRKGMRHLGRFYIVTSKAAMLRTRPLLRFQPPKKR
jgi:hypothetical protein